MRSAVGLHAECDWQGKEKVANGFNLYLGCLEYDYRSRAYYARKAKDTARDAKTNTEFLEDESRPRLDENEEPSKYFFLNINALRIKSLKINASIYSPPVLKAVCFVDEFPIEKILPFYSVFGVVIADPETNDGSTSECCLFANTLDRFTPFVVLDVKDRTEDCVTIILMEKRALSLALNHSFACIGRGAEGGNKKHYCDEALLSIAELVEELSRIEEDEDGGIVPKNKEGVFNFKAISAFDPWTEELYDEPTVYEDDINYDTSNYAFLSRFIASPSQSRLEIISSLMFKYGYGFAFKPEDRQYYAVDLLSNYAPGFYTGRVARCYSGTYNDKYTFCTKDQSSYFSKYGELFLLYNGYSKKCVDFRLKKNENEHYLSHDFADFYVTHLLRYRYWESPLCFFQSSTAWNNYEFIARHSPLSSSTEVCLNKYTRNADDTTEECEIITTPGFDLSISAKIDKEIVRTSKNLYYGNLTRDRDSASVMIQDKLNTYSEGSQTLFFEDQVESSMGARALRQDKVILDKVKIDSVNQRLIYAKYKLNHLRQNFLIQTFELIYNEGLEYTGNLVYSLFQWLGVHTDVIAKIAKNFDMHVNRHVNPYYKRGGDNKNKPWYNSTPSGSTHVIDDIDYEYDNDEYYKDKYERFFRRYKDKFYDEEKEEIYVNLQEFGHNAHLYKNKLALFGKLSIFIERVDENTDDATLKSYYSTTAALYFYSDFTDCNIGFRADPKIIKTKKGVINNADDCSYYSYSLNRDRLEEDKGESKEDDKEGNEEKKEEKKEAEVEIKPLGSLPPSRGQSRPVSRRSSSRQVLDEDEQFSDNNEQLPKQETVGEDVSELIDQILNQNEESEKENTIKRAQKSKSASKDCSSESERLYKPKAEVKHKEGWYKFDQQLKSYAAAIIERRRPGEVVNMRTLEDKDITREIRFMTPDEQNRVIELIQLREAADRKNSEIDDWD